jgi:YegS/Rv2252/BmrU family lipid kinase
MQTRLRRLQQIAGGAVFRPTRAKKHATTLAEQAAREGFGTVVAAGGDGTINEVLNGLMRVPGGQRPRLGVLPLGTANVYANDLELPGGLEAAWSAITAGRERRLDVGLARSADGEARHFAQLAGAGFDAMAIAALNLELKRRINWLAYVIGGFCQLGPHLPQLRVRADGEVAEGHFVFIGNGRYYGGRFAMFPGSQLDSGQLAVCVFGNRRLLDVLRYIQAVLRGVHANYRDVRCFQASRLRVESSKPAPVEVDGELWGHCPAEFSVLPGALRVMVP